MRSLKFRVWNTKRECWTSRVELNGGYGEPLRLEGEKENEGGYMVDNIVIEQYTGLKDKNGKEIYEGDIIRVDSFFDYETISDYVVAWDEDFLCYQLKCIKGVNYDNDLGVISESACEIIGNIHEKSELLKESKNERNIPPHKI